MTIKPVHTIYVDFDNRSAVCELYKLDQTPPETLGDLKEFYLRWKNACGDNVMPSVKDMGFEQLKGWHSNIRLVEYGDSLHASKNIKIMGDVFASYWGRKSMYQQIHSETPLPKDTSEKYFEYLSYIGSKHYGVNIGNVPKPDGRRGKVMWLELPLSNDQETVTHFIAALLPLEDI